MDGIGSLGGRVRVLAREEADEQQNDGSKADAQQGGRDLKWRHD